MIGTSLWNRLRRGETRLRLTSRWIRAVSPQIMAGIMHETVTDRFHSKQGRSTGRWVTPAHLGEPLVVYLKRHYRLSWRERVLALLRPGLSPTPAGREWENLQWCVEQGLPVPQPLACGEYFGPGFAVQSFLAIAELTRMEPLHDLIPTAAATLPSRQFRAWKHELITAMAKLTASLHANYRFHKDLYLCHFYLPIEQIGGDCSQLHLIDLHRLGHHRFLARRWQVKDLAQLLYSTYIPGIEDRDRLRFLREYIRRCPWAGNPRGLIRSVRGKADSYLRHNAKRKAGHEDRTVPRKSAA